MKVEKISLAVAAVLFLGNSLVSYSAFGGIGEGDPRLTETDRKAEAERWEREEVARLERESEAQRKRGEDERAFLKTQNYESKEYLLVDLEDSLDAQLLIVVGVANIQKALEIYATEFHRLRDAYQAAEAHYVDTESRGLTLELKAAAEELQSASQAFLNHIKAFDDLTVTVFSKDDLEKYSKFVTAPSQREVENNYSRARADTHITGWREGKPIAFQAFLEFSNDALARYRRVRQLYSIDESLMGLKESNTRERRQGVLEFFNRNQGFENDLDQFLIRWEATQPSANGSNESKASFSTATRAELAHRILPATKILESLSKKVLEVQSIQLSQAADEVSFLDRTFLSKENQSSFAAELENTKDILTYHRKLKERLNSPLLLSFLRGEDLSTFNDSRKNVLTGAKMFRKNFRDTYLYPLSDWRRRYDGKAAELSNAAVASGAARIIQGEIESQYYSARSRVEKDILSGHYELAKEDLAHFESIYLGLIASPDAAVYRNELEATKRPIRSFIQTMRNPTEKEKIEARKSLSLKLGNFSESAVQFDQVKCPTLPQNIRTLLGRNPSLWTDAETKDLEVFDRDASFDLLKQIEDHLLRAPSVSGGAK